MKSAKTNISALYYINFSSKAKLQSYRNSINGQKSVTRATLADYQQIPVARLSFSATHLPHKNNTSILRKAEMLHEYYGVADYLQQKDADFQ